MVRQFVASAFLLCATAAFAEAKEMSSEKRKEVLSTINKDYMTKVRKHLKSKKLCDVAVMPYFWKKSLRSFTPGDAILCVRTQTVGAGMNETNGCILKAYNLSSGRFGDMKPIIFSGKPCNGGGVQDLLAKKNPYIGKSVGKTLAQPWVAGIPSDISLLLYYRNGKFEKEFRKYAGHGHWLDITKHFK